MIDNSPAFKCGVPVVNGPSPEGTAEGCVRYVMQSSLFSRRYATCRIPSTDPGIEMPGYFQAPRWGAKRPLPVLFLNLTRARWIGTRPTRLRNLLVAAPGRPPAPRFHVETPGVLVRRFLFGPFPRGNGHHRLGAQHSSADAHFRGKEFYSGRFHVKPRRQRRHPTGNYRQHRPQFRHTGHGVSTWKRAQNTHKS